jgi:hypothetical protein
MWAVKCAEIEALILVLLIVSRARVPIMNLNGKSRIAANVRAPEYSIINFSVGGFIVKSRVVLSLVFSLLFTGLLSAGTTAFTGGSDTLWSNPQNWSDGLPGAGDTAKVPNGAFCVLDYYYNATKAQEKLSG